MRSMPWIVVALMTSLAGCVSDSVDRPTVATDAIRAGLARACPTPTPTPRLEVIADYLEHADPSPGLDALATEWERLDEGARAARSPR